MNYKNAYVITGNIGCGKSTVSNLLMLHGFSVIDADKIAHEILNQNATNIQNLFGKEFIIGGLVDRKRLGELVFNDTAKLRELESLLHPQIKAEILAKAAKFEELNFPYFIDIPLFYEKNSYDEFAKVVLVYAPNDILLERVMKRDELSLNSAKSRLDKQMDIELKRQKADFIIDNSGDLKNLNTQIESLIKTIKENNATLKI